MKSVLITLCLVSFILLPLLSYAQKPVTTGKDAILGIWFNAEKDAKIQIYKVMDKKLGERYYGKVIWLKTPLDTKGNPKTDIENPDPKLQSRPRLGLVVLTNLGYNSGAKYDGGKVYDPKSGKTYSCQTELVNNNLMKLRGFIGVSLIGRTSEWTRTQ